MSRTAELGTYERLALADLRALLGDSAPVAVVRRAASVSISVHLNGVILDRCAELRDGPVADSLMISATELPSDLAGLARRAADARARIDSCDRRLDHVAALGEMPGPAGQYLTEWSPPAIARAVESSSARIRASGRTSVRLVLLGDRSFHSKAPRARSGTPPLARWAPRTPPIG